MRARGIVIITSLCLAMAVPPAMASAAAPVARADSAIPTQSGPLGASSATSQRAAVSLQVKATRLANGRLRLRLRTDARKVRVKYVVPGRSTRTKTVRVRKHSAKVTLPGSAISVLVRASATSTRRATQWTRLPIPRRAVPGRPPTSATIAAWETELLGLVNRVRASGTTCPGGRRMAPAPALVGSASLDVAAGGQARWLAEIGRLTHAGRGGSSLGKRLTAAGYPWRRAAENAAAGNADPARTLAQWLGSSGHCRELMNPANRATGIGYAYSTTSAYRHFWVQDFAAP